MLGRHVQVEHARALDVGFRCSRLAAVDPDPGPVPDGVPHPKIEPKLALAVECELLQIFPEIALDNELLRQLVC